LSPFGGELVVLENRYLMRRGGRYEIKKMLLKNMPAGGAERVWCASGRKTNPTKIFAPVADSEMSVRYGGGAQEQSGEKAERKSLVGGMEWWVGDIKGRSLGVKNGSGAGHEVALAGGKGEGGKKTKVRGARGWEKGPSR